MGKEIINEVRQMHHFQKMCKEEISASLIMADVKVTNTGNHYNQEQIFHQLQKHVITSDPATATRL